MTMLKVNDASTDDKRSTNFQTTKARADQRVFFFQSAGVHHQWKFKNLKQFFLIQRHMGPIFKNNVNK
uniref:Uncharacterized protein n=1 Tax=Globodera rostochiensis TaxID=31243 RepID=A0A914HDL8_GLORO